MHRNIVVLKSFVVLSIMLLANSFVNVQAQEQERENDFPKEITITVEEAVQIALVNNYMLRKGILDIETADQQIREAWGAVYPQVNASGTYTRNVVSPNPFAGSDAGGLFESFGAIDWLAFNEGARTDGDAGTDPISFDEYMERQQQGYEDSGITPPGGQDNPFSVENQFEFGASVTQALYNGAAFAAIKGAQSLRNINESQAQLDQQQVIDDIKNAFYNALLAKEQTDVLETSVERLRNTVEETRASVEAGVLSKSDRMSAEVELVNIETDLIEAKNQAELAVKNLSLQLGIPVQTNVQLRGALEFSEDIMPNLLDKEETYRMAIGQRPDLNQADERLGLLDVNRNITRSQYFPTVNAFANAAYVGQLPDDRTAISQVQGEQFRFQSEQRGFFSESYWNPAVAVGISLNWSIFDGFQRSAQVQQNTIEIRQAEIDKEFLKNSIYLEVDQAIKELETAYERIVSQQRNIERAETNYEFARTRLQEGAGTPLEERQASSLLDQSRLNYLSAVHSYVTALSGYEKAIGKPAVEINE
ncbi:MAG: TolC family protein [Balneolaceae bacterium]